MIPVDGIVTSKFDEPRPLNVKKKTHVHGAIDIAAKIGTPIYAIEDGELFYFCSIRDSHIEDGARASWNKSEMFCPWANYFYDVFGGVIILKASSGNIHLFCHSYMNQLFNKALIPISAWKYVEQEKDSRWPVMAFHTLDHSYDVNKGEMIGFVGNAGFSTGSHVHWEIHNGWKFTEHFGRKDPESFLKF
jgi:hypothetical protein